MARKALKLASWTSVALAASGVYLYGNNYLDPNDFGAVRVGRAVATTAVISYDYLTSLRSVPYGSEEYLQRRSQVRKLWDPSELGPDGVCPKSGHRVSMEVMATGHGVWDKGNGRPPAPSYAGALVSVSGTAIPDRIGSSILW
ncbi:aarF domain-containing protein kinase 1-like [Peromyscus leucopus]|uniref:aarF domain-containing protein kinase 1-like n=1 Tax=Peromyscus leucopus TaxID=10041 RepID=UPI001884C7A6|nr:aarF domain-containing protein kinase 1-like [Peromyscus leucopus]